MAPGAVASARSARPDRPGDRPCGRSGTYEEYSPYGSTAWWAEKSGIQVSQKRYRYTGMENDEETGLSYHSARYYATWLGRWCSADPIGLGDGENRYCFARLTPSLHSDRQGLAPDPSNLHPLEDPLEGPPFRPNDLVQSMRRLLESYESGSHFGDRMDPTIWRLVTRFDPTPIPVQGTKEALTPEPGDPRDRSYELRYFVRPSDAIERMSGGASGSNDLPQIDCRTAVVTSVYGGLLERFGPGDFDRLFVMADQRMSLGFGLTVNDTGTLESMFERTEVTTVQAFLDLYQAGSLPHGSIVDYRNDVRYTFMADPGTFWSNEWTVYDRTTDRFLGHPFGPEGVTPQEILDTLRQNFWKDTRTSMDAARVVPASDPSSSHVLSDPWSSGGVVIYTLRTDALQRLLQAQGLGE